MKMSFKKGQQAGCILSDKLRRGDESRGKLAASARPFCFNDHLKKKEKKYFYLLHLALLLLNNLIQQSLEAVLREKDKQTDFVLAQK